MINRTTVLYTLFIIAAPLCAMEEKSGNSSTHYTLMHNKAHKTTVALTTPLSESEHTELWLVQPNTFFNYKGTTYKAIAVAEPPFDAEEALKNTSWQRASNSSPQDSRSIPCATTTNGIRVITAEKIFNNEWKLLFLRAPIVKLSVAHLTPANETTPQKYYHMLKPTEYSGKQSSSCCIWPWCCRTKSKLGNEDL